MSQCLKSFMRKATLKVNIVISLVLRREELKLRVIDQLTKSHTAQKQEKVAFHCLSDRREREANVRAASWAI